MNVLEIVLIASFMSVNVMVGQTVINVTLKILHIPEGHSFMKFITS